MLRDNDVTTLERASEQPAHGVAAASSLLDTTVAVVGLGYVGLPLAVEFGKRFRTVGFDLSQAKVDAYKRYFDPTGEVAERELRQSTLLAPTTEAAALADAD